MRYIDHNCFGENVAMTLNKNIFLYFTLLLACTVLLSSCASTQDQSVMGEASEISDPFESTNRKIFKFNEVVDGNIIHPTVDAYRYVVPTEVRNGVHNFLRNLNSPVIFANQLLQGDIDGAGMVLFRATVNTFVGFGGIFDFAGKEGFEYEGEDFGQTLAVWGFDHGPYLVMPIIGPSSARDYVGYIVDSFADPLRWYLFDIDKEDVYYAGTGVRYLDLRDQLMDVMEELQESSIDYYASTRSIYYQRRNAMVNDEGQNLIGSSAIPDYDDE